jgi:hypothetical protein
MGLNRVKYSSGGLVTVTLPARINVKNHKNCEYYHGGKKRILYGESITLCPKVFDQSAPITITNTEKIAILIA